ncbi:Glycine betaine methyltransferase [subsurface metagenome]
MYDRMQILTEKELDAIHKASMKILGEIGVIFNDEESLKIFKDHNVKVEGKTVFFKEKVIRKSVESAPSLFTISARNPENNITIGEDNYVCAPGYGAPFVMEEDGRRREATMEDYDTFCKMVHTSKYIDLNGFMMVEPSDRPAHTVHLDMLFSSIVLCDKVFMGSPVPREGAQDAIKMAEMIWGKKDKIVNKPVMVSIINSLSPLKYSKEMSESLIEFARYGQPCIISSVIMAGSSGPIKLAGLLGLQNAEILAGITLAQLVNPGTPVVYGSASSITDMRTGGLAIGAPELSMIVLATAQMARYYNLPSRAGGGLTDAHIPDIQAGIESAFALISAVKNGINFILHSCGILSSYLSMSFSKFLIDEEMCGMVKKIFSPIEVTDESIDIKMIKDVGIGGEYISQPKTLDLCRKELFLPDLMCRKNFYNWEKSGKKEQMKKHLKS